MSPPARVPDETCDTHAAAALFRTLAHPMRLTILCRLLDGELSVAGLESELGLKQPSLSQQLAVLREANLVMTRREAKAVFYSLADRRMRAIVDALRDAMNIAPQPNLLAPDTQTDLRADLFSGSVAAEAPLTSLIRNNHVAGCGVFAVVG
jgi:ArsR family transcriptional regulator